MRISFIGAGRVGSTLAIGFARAGFHVAMVASRNPDSAAALAAKLPGRAVAAGAQQAADGADIVFLSVSDDAIAVVAESVRWRPGTCAVHCSGAADLDVLQKAASDGASVGGFHPLQMFSEPEVTLKTLPGSAIALAGDDALIARLEPLARALGAMPFRLPTGTRALYHASANFVGGFAIALIQEAVEIWRCIGVSDADAIAALLPLLRGTIAGVERLGTANALGTVISRGDIGTIEKHLAALGARAPQSLELYRLLSLRTIPLALEQGGLKTELAQRITQLLSNPSSISGARHDC